MAEPVIATTRPCTDSHPPTQHTWGGGGTKCWLFIFALDVRIYPVCVGGVVLRRPADENIQSGSAAEGYDPNDSISWGRGAVMRQPLSSPQPVLHRRGAYHLHVRPVRMRGGGGGGGVTARQRRMGGGGGLPPVELLNQKKKKQLMKSNLCRMPAGMSQIILRATND